MAKGAKYVVAYRRKRSQQTDYKKRLDLLKSKKSRLAVRSTNKHITVQVIKYGPNGDEIIASANSVELKNFGWKHATGNIPASYLTGLLAGTRVKSKEGTILDTGLQTRVNGSRIYSALKGAVDSGLDIPHDGVVFPPEDRVSGSHIEAHSKAPITKSFETVKKAILSQKKEARK